VPWSQVNVQRTVSGISTSVSISASRTFRADREATHTTQPAGESRLTALTLGRAHSQAPGVLRVAGASLSTTHQGVIYLKVLRSVRIHIYNIEIYH
jgi:hypothetical protein